MSNPNSGGQTAAAPPVSRRKVLAAMAAAGAVIAAEGVLGKLTPADADGTCCETVTIADLRANTAPQANHLYYVHERGKEGLFLYDASDSASPDNAGTIVVSSSGARFKRLYGDWIDVRWFGAIGDGSSHPVGTLPNANFPSAISTTDETDWAAIQAAINWAKQAGSKTGKVFVPSGTYLINRPIRPEGDNLELKGTSGTVLSLKANDAAIETGTGVSTFDSIVLRELAIHATSGFGPSDKGILHFDNAVDVLIDHVRIVANAATLTTNSRNCNGISFDNVTSSAIRHCVVEGTTKAGILLAAGTSKIRLDGNVVKEITGPAGNQPGIMLRGCEDIIVYDCQSLNNQGAGLHVEAASGVNTSTIHVTAGRYASNGGSGILVTSGADGSNPTNVHIVSTLSENNGKDGLCVEAGVHVLIAHPIARFNGECGFNFSQKYTATSNLNMKFVKVTCPIAYNNGQTATADGIRIKATHRLAIRGGAVYDNQGTATQDYGIRIEADTNNKVPQHLFLQDIDVYGNTANYDLNSVQAVSGHYRIAYQLPSPGTPESVIAAPIGSEFIDRTSGGGRKFLKKTGTSTTGWKVMTFVP